MKEGLVGSIERFALHDGPGIRTTVFLKGCPLSCAWCHNPELRSSRPQVAFYPSRCIGCGDCEAACPEGAAGVRRPDRVDRSLCTGCSICADGCPTRALELIGRVLGVDEVLDVVLRDVNFYASSGGGVTLSGGEPTSQMEFCRALLEGFKREGLHTVIQTSGFFPWDTFSEALASLDLVLFDLKLADSTEHRRLTGQGNELILENLGRLVKARPDDVIARIPLIPGYTATERNMANLSERLRALGVRRCTLLPYHPYGRSKAENVGLPVCPGLPEAPMSTTEVARWSRFFWVFAD